MSALFRSLVGVAGVGVYCASLYGGYRYYRVYTCPAGCSPSGKMVWDTLADTYDKEVRLDEVVTGMRLLRWWLISQAKGDVLEVSAGTGRNLPFYTPKQLSSLTLTDSSKSMLFFAREKAAARKKLAEAVPLAVHLSDAGQLAAPDDESGAVTGAVALPPRVGEPSSSPYASALRVFRPASFTTVVDTFGLCSHDDPVATLREMAAVCKPDGQLLLLEHGRASSKWVNSKLDGEADKHLAKFGCYWNRPILDIVAEAGLEVERVSRWHFGTTYLIVARPGRGHVHAVEPR